MRKAPADGSRSHQGRPHGRSVAHSARPDGRSARQGSDAGLPAARRALRHRRRQRAVHRLLRAAGYRRPGRSDDGRRNRSLARQRAGASEDLRPLLLHVRCGAGLPDARDGAARDTVRPRLPQPHDRSSPARHRPWLPVLSRRHPYHLRGHRFGALSFPGLAGAAPRGGGGGLAGGSGDHRAASVAGRTGNTGRHPGARARHPDRRRSPRRWSSVQSASPSSCRPSS